MRILMFSHGYPPTVSGVTLVVQKLARDMVRKGHQVAVVTASDRGPSYRTQDEGVQVIRLKSRPNPFWREGPLPAVGLETLRTLVKDFKPDLIHTHENVFFSMQLLRLGALGIPRIISCYFLPRYVTHYLRFGRWGDRALQAAIWKFAVSTFNRFDHVVFSTQTQVQDYLKHGLTAPWTVISNGVDTRRYFPPLQADQEVEQRYHLPVKPRLLFVGRLMKDKRIDLLIQAMPYVCEVTPAHLLIVGRGQEQPYLQDLVRILGVEPYVHLLGYVPEQDLPGLYRASDLFTIASICEVQSIPALQAAVTGLPMVAVDAAALPELVHDQVNGRLVPPDDPHALGMAILEIIKDRARAQAYGKASLEIGRPHAESETFLHYDRFYQASL